MTRTLADILKSLDWSPLFISLKTGIVATLICFVLGILTAGWVMGRRSGIRAVIDSVLTLPMVLPPTASGFFLLLLFSRRRPVGIWLYDHFDIKIVQSWAGCVIAAFVISFPLMYRNARAAFEQVDINLIYAGRTLGMSDWRIFCKVVYPAARPGIASGTVLTFSRAIGEYGATSMLAGNIPGKTATISQRIAMVIQNGDYVTAGIWAFIVMLIAFAVIIVVNALTGPSGRNTIKW
ncbi:MAG: molybdate ABC transporter permease subunit [Eubacterium sp.]|nr:molybdate ABC transporter permease subunit [Eubacterium sp.]